MFKAADAVIAMTLPASRCQLTRRDLSSRPHVTHGLSPKPRRCFEADATVFTQSWKMSLINTRLNPLSGHLWVCVCSAGER